MFSSKQLTEDQKNTIRTWADQGANMSDIQRRMEEEFSLRVTYMDTRFLILDLGITLQEPSKEEPKKDPVTDEQNLPFGEGEASTVQVTRDELTIPGTMYSGKVLFSDGEKALWYVDETGRLGLDPDTTGYRPSQEDIMAFQMELKKLLR